MGHTLPGVRAYYLEDEIKTQYSRCEQAFRLLAQANGPRVDFYYFQRICKKLLRDLVQENFIREQLFRIDITAGLSKLRTTIQTVSSKDTRIMVVDDEYDIVHVVRRYLETCGYSVDTFTNPLYALEMFRQKPDRYSVVLTDINMREIRGTALARAMKQVTPSLNVIIMTAFDIEPEDLAVNLPRIKREDILKKPFTMNQVCGTIQKHLQSN